MAPKVSKLTLLQVFNPQVTTIDGKILTTKVSKHHIQVIINSDLIPLLYQKMTIAEWDVYAAMIKEDHVYSEFHFYVDKQPPLALSNFLIIEFDTVQTC